MIPESGDKDFYDADEVSESDKVAVEADFYHRCEILLFITSGSLRVFRCG